MRSAGLPLFSSGFFKHPNLLPQPRGSLMIGRNIMQFKQAIFGQSWAAYVNLHGIFHVVGNNIHRDDRINTCISYIRTWPAVPEKIRGAFKMAAKWTANVVFLRPEGSLDGSVPQSLGWHNHVVSNSPLHILLALSWITRLPNLLTQLPWVHLA